MIKTIRLTSTIRPTKTFQEKLTNENIEQLLEDYIEVDQDQLFKIPINSHLRYYTIKELPNGSREKLFRMGGQLMNKDNCNEYVILSNGKNSWSVQTKTSIIYRKLKIDELKDNFEQQIKDKNNTINKLKKQIDNLKNK